VFTLTGYEGSFPAIAGGSLGFSATYMDQSLGSWNVWSAQSSDGLSWSTPVRISNAVSGPPYVSSSGFASPYGDYSGISIFSSGKAIAAWGESAS
jgi:hypothetical protein